MSGRSAELPSQETGKGKERAQPPQLDVTRQQTRDKRTREQRSPTESGSYSTSSGDGRGPASQPVEKKSRTQRDTVPTQSDTVPRGATSGLDLLAGAIGKHRQIEGGKKGGATSRANGTGIFGMTPEARSEANRKGGATNRANGTGIFGMTPEAKREASRKAGKIGGATNLANGTGLFGMTEDGRPVYEVAREKKYQVSMSEQNAMAYRAAGYKPPQWATREASGSGS
jgi:hypothetical protein